MRSVQLQSFGFNVCGQFCIYFLARRLKGCTREEFYNTFSRLDFKHNDLFVQKFVNTKSHLVHGKLCKYNKTHVQCCKVFAKK